MTAIIEYECCVCGKKHRRTFPVEVKTIELEERTMHACKDCDMVTPHAMRLVTEK